LIAAILRINEIVKQFFLLLFLGFSIFCHFYFFSFNSYKSCSNCNSSKSNLWKEICKLQTCKP
jgi:hypothetical protein